MARVFDPSEAPAAPRTAPVGQYRDASGNVISQSAIAASLAANPQASKGGYEGVGTAATPGPVGQTNYGTANAPLAAPTYDPYDYSADPILNKIKAGNVTARQNAQTAKLAALRTEAIRFGDASDLNDPTVTAEAAGNPYSVLAALKRGYDTTVHDHGEQLNQNNLWYSGAHAKALADDANAYQGQDYQARQAHADIVGQVNAGLASALSGADSSDMSAEGDAAKRATDLAAAYGYDPGSITDTAHANMGTATASAPPPPAAAPVVPAKAQALASTPTNFFTDTSLSRQAAPVATKPVAKPKAPTVLKNAYLTSSTKRG